MSGENRPSVKFDRDGFPIIPGLVEMDDQSRRARMLKAREYRGVCDEIRGRSDVSSDEKDLLLFRVLTNPTDTVTVIQLGLAGRIIKDYEDTLADFEEEPDKLSEMVSFGIHWSWNGDLEHDVHIGIDMYGYTSDGFLGSSGLSVSQMGQLSDLTPEQIEVLVQCADSKEY